LWEVSPFKNLLSTGPLRNYLCKKHYSCTFLAATSIKLAMIFQDFGLKNSAIFLSIISSKIYKLNKNNILRLLYYLKPWVMKCPNGGLHSNRTVSSIAFSLEWLEPWVHSFTRNTPRNTGVPQIWYFFNKCVSDPSEEFPRWHQRDSTSNSALQWQRPSRNFRKLHLTPYSAHIQKYFNSIEDIIMSYLSNREISTLKNSPQQNFRYEA